jgi:wyosine [tRNA(Phe)-imidazoG37] synthetase (radical SAM superfamily)
MTRLTEQEERTRPFRHLFGPVPSRRLGRSLGVDLVPHKVCSLDCVYCECGRTTHRTLVRDEWVETAAVLDELARWLESGVRADHVTFSGSGEPTLHRDLGRIARWIVTRTATPLALLTNATLLGDPALRAEVQPCALILPSLDAADEATYRRVNRPYPGLTAADLIDGLVALRAGYEGRIWLEVLLIEGLNDGPASLSALARAIARIRPDKVQVNTAVRPGTEPDVGPAGQETLDRALAAFGAVAEVEVVASFAARCGAPGAAAPPAPGRDAQQDAAAAALLAVVRRRPETVPDLAAALDLPLAACRAAVEALVERGLVIAEERGGATYVVATSREG